MQVGGGRGAYSAAVLAGQAQARCADRFRVAHLRRIRLHWLRTPNQSMARPPLSFRPTEAQRQWLDRQRRERGIPVTTVIQLLLEQAIANGQELHERS